MKRKLLSMALACTMCLSMLPAPAALAASTTRYVSQDGGEAGDGSIDNPYATIQDAYAASSEGDTICIQGELSLTEPVTLDDDKTVTLTGQDGGALTYIASTNISTASAGVLTVNSGQVTIRDLTVQMPTDKAANGRSLYVGPGAEVILGRGSVIANGYLAYSGGNICVDGGSLTMENGSAVQDAYIANNTDCYGGGVWVTNGGSFTMIGGSIQGNVLHTTQGYGCYGGGVAVDADSTFVMQGGAIEGNSVDTAGGGVYVIPGGVMQLGGDVSISGNTAGDTDSNLYIAEDVTIQLINPVSGQIGVSSETADYHVPIGTGDGYIMQPSDEDAFAYDSGEYDIRLKDDALVLYWYTVQVISSLDGVTSDNEDTENPIGQDYDTVLIPDEGYQLPESITVTVGGKTLAEDKYSYDPDTGALHIPADQVAGNIRLTVDADAIRSITVEVENVFSDVDATTAIYQDTVVIRLTAADRYTLPNEEDISISGTCGHSYDRGVGVLLLNRISSDITVTIKGAEVYHTLTFDPGEGSCDTTEVEITESQPTLGTLPTPFREGYTFSGWYAGTELVTAETVNQLTDDLHLTARWTQKTNITYVVEHWMEYVASGVNPGYSGQTLQTMTHNGVSHQYYRYAAPVFEDGIANGRLELASFTLDALTDGLVMDGCTPSGANIYSVVVAPDGSSVFPLFYGRNRYTVRYDANGGSMGGNGVSTTVTYGSQYAVMPSPTRAGYTFAGWFTDPHGGMQVQAGDVYFATADQTLYAHWTPVGTTPYTVYHLAQNLKDNTVSPDKIPDNYTVVHTDHLTGTSDTTVDLYAMAMEGFIPSDANNYAITILADGNSTAYLYYDRKITDVAFDSMGGSDVEFAMRLYYGGTFAFLPAAPVKVGYTFAGWYTGPASTARRVEAGTPINTINPDGLTELTLYARWTPNTYDLIFEPHGGVLSAPKRVTYGEAVGELPTAALTGYTFAGWYDKDGKLGVPEGNLITAETMVNTNTIIQAKDGVETPKTLYAWYEPVEITLTFDAGEGRLVGDHDLTAIYDNPLGELPVPTREGYTFKAWHLGSVDGQAMTADTVCKLVEDSTLYAEYAPNLYVVKLDVNGGDALDKPTLVGTFDAPYSQLPTPNRMGHTFLGWFNVSGEQVQNDTILTTPAGHTLTARWQANTYTVTFHAGEGAELEGAATRTVSYGQSYGELPSPKRSGYMFSGWFTAEKDGLLVTKDTVLSNAADHTLYAHWQIRSSGGGGGGGGGSYVPPTNTLTFDTDGGSDIPPVQGSSNTIVDLDKYKPSRPGHTFVGWSVDGKDIVTSIKLKGDIAVIALWEKGSNLSAILETEKHQAYLAGFPDGTIRPNDTISRAEIAQMLYRLLTVDTHLSYDTAENDFVDVPANEWYSIPVSTLANMGILKGRDGGRFDPSAPISRAEFAVIMSRFEGGSYIGEDRFDDISDCWAKAEINYVADLGWVKGDEEGRFLPDRFLTRAEVVTVFNRALGRCPEAVEDLLSGSKTFPDNADETAWYYLDIQEAANSHSYTRKADGVHETWTPEK